MKQDMGVSISKESDKIALEVNDLSAWFGLNQVLRGIEISAPRNQVTALIGPSGCGKSTFLRCLNRLHEEVEGGRVEGSVLLMTDSGPIDIYARNLDPVAVRRQIGMVFQKPNPFPGLSIFENVAVGPRLSGIRRKSVLEEVVETSLKHAALWNEVKDKLTQSGSSLSGGQQQRLCIARALAVRPKVLLMDEPTSALDPISTARIEELVMSLRADVTVLIVTHNMQQAARISDQTAFFLSGELVESGPTKQVFTKPRQSQTEAYITGRFG